MTALGDSAFWGCASLKRVVWPKSATALGDKTFYRCEALREFSTVPDSTAFRAVDGVLFSADGKTLVAYPPGRESGEYRVPPGTERIGDRAFYQTRRLKSVEFPPGLTAIGADAFGESGLKRVEFPASLRTVGVGAFSWCGLERIAFSEGLETLGAQAFYNCLSLETVELPASLTNIGGEAFEIDFDVDPNPKRDLRLIAPDGSFAAKYAEENRMKRVAPEK